jgi:hypothetical protein
MSRKYTNEQIAAQSCRLTHEMEILFDGSSTAAVYVAIANMLANIESMGTRRDRDGLFKILNDGMDLWHKAQEPA